MSPALLTIAPAKAARRMVPGADGPKHKAGLADDLFFGEIAPVPAVVAIHRVVTECQVMTGTHHELGLLVGKKRGQPQMVILSADGAVDVTRIMVGPWREV